MRKLFIGIQIGLYALVAILVLVLSIVFSFNEKSFMIALYAMMISGMLGLIIVLISTIYKVELKRLTPAIPVALVTIGVILYYLWNYVLDYEKTKLILWLIYWILPVIIETILIIINEKLSPRKLVAKR